MNATGKKSSRTTAAWTAEATTDDDNIIVLEKRPTPRQGGDEDYAKTIDECLHVELTKHHFVACGAEKPQHRSTMYYKKNPIPLGVW